MKFLYPDPSTLQIRGVGSCRGIIRQSACAARGVVAICHFHSFMFARAAASLLPRSILRRAQGGGWEVSTPVTQRQLGW